MGITTKNGNLALFGSEGKDLKLVFIPCKSTKQKEVSLEINSIEELEMLSEQLKLKYGI